MIRFKNTVTLLMLVFILAGLNGCLTEDREIEIVLNDENCEAIHEVHTSGGFVTPQFMAIGEEIDSLLADNDISREQILDGFLVSASYEIKEFTHEEDWRLEGVITVQRFDIYDTPDTLVVYTSITVSEALVGEKTYVTLHEGGVAKINQAIDDFIAGAPPMLLLRIENAGVEPEPSAADPLDFTWEFCIFIQVVAELDTEIFQLF
jgi:hypothetical protein